MGYKVIHYFEDLQDFNHAYKVGDTFPRLGVTVTEGRLKELSSKNNRRGKPLIEKVAEVEVKKVEKVEKSEKPEEKPVAVTKTQINRMALAELKEFAKIHEVNDAEKASGAELKKMLIKKLGL